MALVQPQQGATGFARVGTESAELLPRVFRVTGLTVGEDATQVTGIPAKGSTFILGGRKYTCDRTDVTNVITDTACDVSAFYSTDGRFDFRVVPPRTDAPDFKGYVFGYRKTTIDIPRYVKGVRAYSTGPGGTTALADYWDFSPLPFDIQMRTFNTVVNLIDVPSNLVLTITEIVDAQTGHLHIFPGSERFWVMQPAVVLSNEPGKLQIAYSWESDPGNGPLENSDPANIIVPTFERNPFVVYITRPATTATPRPVITSIQTFPASSPFYEPLGWQTLPGNPI